jgi:hypothetical protein
VPFVTKHHFKQENGCHRTAAVFLFGVQNAAHLGAALQVVNGGAFSNQA